MAGRLNCGPGKWPIRARVLCQPYNNVLCLLLPSMFRSRAEHFQLCIISGSGYWTYSTASFLFSLKNHLNQQYKMLTYRNHYNAIYSSSSYGPTFGGGHDLYLPNSCHTNNGHSELGYTYRPPNGYGYTSSQARSVLAGSLYFTCDEYEVFYQAWLETKSNSCV